MRCIAEPQTFYTLDPLIHEPKKVHNMPVKWWNELITRLSSKEANAILLEESITLIHVVNCCLWPGQIPPGNAICPTCSNKHSGKTQHPRWCQRDGGVFVWRLRRREPHILGTQLNGHIWLDAFTCAMFLSFGDVSWENTKFPPHKVTDYILPERLHCFCLAQGCLLSWTFLFIFPPWLSCILLRWWTCSLQMMSSGFPICSALSVPGSSSSASAGPSELSCPPCTASNGDTSSPCSRQSLEEKAD